MKIHSDKKIIINSLISICSIVLVLILWTFNLFHTLELKSLDLRFLIRGAKEARDDIVIVALDDQTFSELGIYPLPRSYYAKTIQNLNKAGAKAIIFDITFSDASPDSAQDRFFVDAVKAGGNVVLCEKIAVTSQFGKHRQDSLEPLIPQLRAVAADTGYIDTYQDDDGFVREYMVARRFLGRAFPSLGLTAVGRLKEIPPGQEVAFSATRVQYKDMIIPLTQGSRMLINYAGPVGTFSTYSLEQVLDDKPNPEALDGKSGFDILNKFGVFKDKIVLIGATFSEAHDAFPTPFYLYDTKALTPGVEIHANAIQTILNSDYIYRFGFLGRLLILLVFSGVTGILMTHTRPLVGVISIVGIIIVITIFSFLLFVKFNLWMDTTDSIGVVFLSYLGSIFYQYINARKERMAIKGMFAHYLAEAVVEELITNPDMLELGGEERFMTVLFSDIEGFTTMSEKLSPTVLANILNEYLTEMTDIIIKHKGIIDKYEGDAIMAEFGAPIYFEDHALRACLAALECQKRLTDLRKKWQEQGKPLLKTRIGINTGNMVVGNFGSRNVFNYTVIGDSVNLGARLESANKEYGTYLMISETTYEEVKDGIETRFLDKLQVKGKTEPVKVYQILSPKKELSPEMAELRKLYQKGLVSYYDRNWQGAVKYFEAALRIDSQDGPSNVYLTRANYLRKNEPDENWDGVTILTTK